MNTPESVSIAQMRTIVLEKLSPEDLWKTLISEVVFYSEFKLSGVLKEKADKELANMKRNIMNIANIVQK